MVAKRTPTTALAGYRAYREREMAKLTKRRNSADKKFRSLTSQHAHMQRQIKRLIADQGECLDDLIMQQNLVKEIDDEMQRLQERHDVIMNRIDELEEAAEEMELELADLYPDDDLTAEDIKRQVTYDEVMEAGEQLDSGLAILELIRLLDHRQLPELDEMVDEVIQQAEMVVDTVLTARGPIDRPGSLKSKIEKYDQRLGRLYDLLDNLSLRSSKLAERQAELAWDLPIQQIILKAYELRQEVCDRRLYYHQQALHALEMDISFLEHDVAQDKLLIDDLSDQSDSC